MESSLNDDLLEQNGRDSVGCDRGIDPAGQLFLEAVEAGRSIEVRRTQLPQVSLKGIHDSRHQRLDLRHQRRIRQFEYDLDLEILGTVCARIRQVDQDVRQIDESRGLGCCLLYTSDAADD